MRRSDVCLYLGPAARAELQALITDRNTSRKFAQSARNCHGVETGELVGGKIVPGNAALLPEITKIWAGMDGANRHGDT